MDSFQNIRLDLDGHIAEIVLNRPQQRNAVSGALIDELTAALQAVEADDNVRVVLLRGEGPAFCAGNDLKERAGMTVDDLRARRKKGHAAFKAIEQFPKPCIAVVHGAAIAAGCEISWATDFVIAGEEASFRYPVAVRGSVGDALRLPHIVGQRIAKEILFTGRVVKADEALRIGLVNHVLPTDQLLEFARSTARTIAENPPHAMISIKRAIETGAPADPDSQAKMEQEAIDAAVAFQSERQGSSD